MSVAPLSRLDRILIWACILLITILAWAYLVHMYRQMSSSMEYDRAMEEMGMPMDTPWTGGTVFFTFAMWVVMMVGMMAGAATPVLLLFGSAYAGRSKRMASPVVLLFGLGYLTVWVGFSAAATVAQWVLHETAILSPAMAARSPYVAGMILIAAGVYQLTPWKGACLKHCRSPLGFLMTNWRDGKLGAVRMGLNHGAYCFGCCWALMCVLFAVGVMNLAWVAVLTGLVLIEKIGPTGAIVARVAGVVMAALGFFLMGFGR